jgi:hypothetical protein
MCEVIIYATQNILNKLGEAAILLDVPDKCPVHMSADKTIILTKVFLTVPFNKT